MFETPQFNCLLDVTLEVEARLDGDKVRLGDVLALRAGSVVVLPHVAGENVQIYAGQAPIGSGELGSANRRTIVRMAQLGRGV